MKYYFDLVIRDNVSGEEQKLFQDMFGDPFEVSKTYYDEILDSDQEDTILHEMYARFEHGFESLLDDLILRPGLIDCHLEQFYPVAFDLINHITFFDSKIPEYVYYVNLNGVLRRKSWSDYVSDQH